MTSLAAVAGGAPAVPFAFIGSDAVLTRELQSRLAAVGLLDPPADGQFGPVSTWALGAFRQRIGHTAGALDGALANSLLAPTATTLFPCAPGGDLAGRVVAALSAKGWWLCRHPRAVTIVYVERCDFQTGLFVASKPNRFCDARLLIRVRDDGVPTIDGAWNGTTAPGRHWVEHPMNPRGAARIKPGQYKAWRVGIHKDHEALRQVAPVTVTRDLDKNFDRTNDLAEPLESTLNQHWGYNQPVDAIDKASAGCLVGRLKGGHVEFMGRLKQDPRFRANAGYLFMTAVLDQTSL